MPLTRSADALHPGRAGGLRRVRAVGGAGCSGGVAGVARACRRETWRAGASCVCVRARNRLAWYRSRLDHCRHSRSSLASFRWHIHTELVCRARFVHTRTRQRVVTRSQAPGGGPAIGPDLPDPASLPASLPPPARAACRESQSSPYNYIYIYTRRISIHCRNREPAPQDGAARLLTTGPAPAPSASADEAQEASARPGCPGRLGFATQSRRSPFLRPARRPWLPPSHVPGRSPITYVIGMLFASSGS